MRTILFLFLGVLSAVPRLLCAQSLTFQGSVVEKNGRTPIPYASVRLINEKVSTGADDKGTFKLLSSNPVENDTLLFSAIGYRTIKIPVAGFVQKRVVQLEEDIQFLNEVKVLAKFKRKTITLNSLDAEVKAVPDWSYAGFRQTARKFIAPAEYSRLKQVSIRRYLTRKSPFENKDCRFRIRVYDVDEITGAPGVDISHRLIEVEETGNRQLITLDLSRYNIVIPKKTFFVAIEWLFIGFNESIQMTLGPRFASEFESEKGSDAAILEYRIRYEPIIYSMDDSENMRNIYQQNPNGTWIHPDKVVTSGPAISTVLTYTVQKK